MLKSPVQDLGELNKPVLIFGGPYSNLEATQALLKEARRRAIPPHRMLCTGDIVAYFADPQATVDVVRNAAIPAVMGNCEESLGTDADDCGCDFAEGSTCDLLANQWYSYALRALDAESKAWMRQLPKRISFGMAGRRLVVVHGGVNQINRYVFPRTPATDKRRELDLAGTDGVIAGHSGVPFTQVLDARLWHNAGAIGMPANDGTPRVWYSILRPSDREIVIEHHSLEYDRATTVHKMRERGLPRPYAEALETGLWPSDDVMTEEDRQQRGHALRLDPVTWHETYGCRSMDAVR